MSITQTWVVSEQSGRWAAVLRLAIARQPRPQLSLQLFEVRSLAELLAHWNEHPCDLALVEVDRANLADILKLLAEGRSSRIRRCFALLDHSLYPRDPAESLEVGRQPIVDALREAGAVDVIETPRSVDRLFALGKHLAAAFRSGSDYSREDRSVTDWAWSSLPWQNES